MTFATEGTTLLCFGCNSKTAQSLQRLTSKYTPFAYCITSSNPHFKEEISYAKNTFNHSWQFN